jgi:hypothetical protein
LYDTLREAVGSAEEITDVVADGKSVLDGSSETVGPEVGMLGGVEGSEDGPPEVVDGNMAGLIVGADGTLAGLPEGVEGIMVGLLDGESTGAEDIDGGVWADGMGTPGTPEGGIWDGGPRVGANGIIPIDIDRDIDSDISRTDRPSITSCKLYKNFQLSAVDEKERNSAGIQTRHRTFRPKTLASSFRWEH